MEVNNSEPILQSVLFHLQPSLTIYWVNLSLNHKKLPTEISLIKNVCLREATEDTRRHWIHVGILRIKLIWGILGILGICTDEENEDTSDPPLLSLYGISQLKN